MAKKNATVTLRGRFPVGTSVGLYPAYGDHFHPGAKPVKTAKTDAAGETHFAGLEHGNRFFAAAEVDGTWRSATVIAKSEPTAPGDQPGVEKLSAAQVRERLAQTRPPQEDRTVVVGARSSTDARARGRNGDTFASAQVGRPLPKGEVPQDPVPHGRQEDATGPQMSDTLTGQATPTDPNAPIPAMRQQDVPEGTPQMSDTPLGTATPIPDPEVPAPNLRQEDASKGLVQRSATPHGVVTPIPALNEPRGAQKGRGRAKAKGDTRKAKTPKASRQRRSQRPSGASKASSQQSRRRTTRRK